MERTLGLSAVQLGSCEGREPAPALLAGPALELAQIKAFDSLNSVSAAPADLAVARQWTAVAVSRDPKNPALWTLLAGAEVDIKAYGLARTDYDRALSCDKWYTQALQGLAQLAETDHDWSRAIHFYRLALTTAVNDAVMSASLRASLSAAEGHVASVAADARSRDRSSLCHAECRNWAKVLTAAADIPLVAVSIDPRRKAS